MKEPASRRRPALVAAFLAAALAIGLSRAAAPAAETVAAIVSPSESRARMADRIEAIKREVRGIDGKLRAPGLAEPDYRVLQDLRTSLEQERKLLEEQQALYGRVLSSPVLMHLLAGTTAAAVAAPKSLWESGGWARFAGVLPCADCEGIRTEITFYNDGLTYVLEERYLGESAPVRAFKSEGRWTTLRGHGKDPDATVLQLDYDKPGKERHFLHLNADEIKLVDLDEGKLRKKPNLVLRRVAP